MPWIAIALVGTFLLARGLRLGVQASLLAAATFALSGVPVLAARAGSLRQLTAAGNEPVGSIDFVATGLLLVLVALVLAFQRFTQRDEDGSTPDGWLSGAIGLGLAFVGTTAVLASRGMGRAAFHLIAPERLVRWPPVPVSSWIAFAGLALATVSIFAGAGTLRGRVWILSLGIPALLVGMDVPGTAGLQALVPGHTAALMGALALALLAGEGLERAADVRPARVAAFFVLLPLVVLVRLQPTIVPPPISPSRAPEESELLGFHALPDPTRTNEHGEAVFEGWLAPTSRIESACLVLTPLDSVDTSRREPRTIPVELDVPALAAGDVPPGARRFRARVPVNALDVGHWSYRIDFLAPDGVTALASRFVGMLTIPPPRMRDLLTLVLSLVVLATLLLPWRRGISARVILVCALLQGAAFVRSAELL